MYNGELEEGQSAQVQLTARLLLDERSFERDYQLRIIPPEEDEAVSFDKEVMAALGEAAGRDRTQEQVFLPEIVAGRRLLWKVSSGDLSGVIFLLLLLAAVFSFRAGEKELHGQIERRRKQLRLEYPTLLSRLVLYAGAGMSVRGAFIKIGKEYLAERERGGEERPSCEEVVRMCRELDSGIPEQECYLRFGRRCGLLQYSRFCSLLTQHLRKGNSALLAALQNEASASFAERRTLARQLGEEAGTKLLMPMILMLIVTMVMIVIPAYSSFAM